MLERPEEQSRAQSWDFARKIRRGVEDVWRNDGMIEISIEWKRNPTPQSGGERHCWICGRSCMNLGSLVSEREWRSATKMQKDKVGLSVDEAVLREKRSLWEWHKQCVALFRTSRRGLRSISWATAASSIRVLKSAQYCILFPKKVHSNMHTSRLV